MTAPPSILTGGMPIEEIMNTALALYSTTIQPGATMSDLKWTAVTTIPSLVGADGL